MVAIAIDSTEAVIKGNGRNLILSFNLSTCDSRDKEAESSIFEIGHLAEVRFKFFYVIDKIMRTSVSFKIHKSKMGDNDKINVTCEVDDKTIHFVCTQDWSEYMELCDKRYFFWAGNNLTYIVKANISASVTRAPASRIFYEDDSFTDFQIVSDDSNISNITVHKVVMAAHSAVFKAMLDGEWKETTKDRLEVKGATQETLQHLKEYMYLGSLPEHEHLRPLLLIAKCYMMHDLEEECVGKLARTVLPCDLLDLIKFATDNHLPELVLTILEITPHEVVSSAREDLWNRNRKS